MKKSISLILSIVLALMVYVSPMVAQAQDLTSVDSLITQLELEDEVVANRNQLYIPIKKYSNYCKTLSDGKTDWASAIQKAIDDLAPVGGTLYLPAGTYYINSSIQLKDKVRLIGDGKITTIIRTTGDFDAIQIIITMPSINGRFNGGIEDLGIVGVYAQNGTQVGVNFINNDTSLRYPSDFGYANFDGISVTHCATGVKVGQKIGVLNLLDFYISKCSKYGMEIHGTDNQFSNFNIAQCLNGLYSPGSNNKFSDMKINWNGLLYNGYTFDYTKTFGMKICGNRNSFSNIEAQENLGNGIIFENCYGNTLNGVIADANGNGLEQVSGAGQFGDGFKFINCHDFVGNIIATSFHKVSCQVNGMTIDEKSYNMSLNYTENNQIKAFNASNFVKLDIKP